MKSRLRSIRLALVVLTGALASCSMLKEREETLAEFFQPYRIEIVQGNVVTQEQLAVLRPGLTRNQVREVLGSPLITSLFHGERWDYAFAIRRKGTPPLQRHVSVYFEGDRMTRVEADELPTEAEFTARIDSKLKGTLKIPNLQASEDELKPYLPKQEPTAPAPNLAPFNMAYPPLEPQ